MEETNLNPTPAPAANTEVQEEIVEEEEATTEDLAIEAHERLNALIAVLLKKETFSEEELEFEAFKQDRENEE